MPNLLVDYNLQPGTHADLGSVLTLSAAASNANSADLPNTTRRGIRLMINISAITGTSPTLTVTLQGKDTASGSYYTILQSASLNATGETIMTVYPGLTASANAIASDVLPPTWRVTATIGGTTPAVTATIAAVLIN